MAKEIKLPDWTSEYCDGCGAPIPVEVLKSNAGYYIGQFCYEQDGPYSRLSEQYYRTFEEAQDALDNGTFKMRLHP